MTHLAFEVPTRKSVTVARYTFLQFRYFSENRYFTGNVERRENGALGLSPNDSASKTTLINDLADFFEASTSIRMFKL